MGHFFPNAIAFSSINFTPERARCCQVLAAVSERPRGCIALPRAVVWGGKLQVVEKNEGWTSCPLKALPTQAVLWLCEGTAGSGGHEPIPQPGPVLAAVGRRLWGKATAPSPQPRSSSQEQSREPCKAREALAGGAQVQQSQAHPRLRKGRAVGAVASRNPAMQPLPCPPQRLLSSKGSHEAPLRTGSLFVPGVGPI